MTPEFEIVDSKIASALKKLLSAGFKRRVCKEEQEAQQDNRFLKRRQTAFLICVNFNISGTGEALLDFNELLRVQLMNDNVQCSTPSGTKYFSPCQKFPMKIYGKNMHKKQLHYSEDLKPLVASCLQNTVQKWEAASYYLIESNSGSPFRTAEDKRQ